MDRCSRCQQCNASLSGQAVGGLCATCLLKLALEPPAEETLERDGWTPPGEPIRLRHFGDYELLEEIARGGMGVVYKARQVSLNRIVALKMILAGNFSSPAMVARFQTEAEAEARLEHPNIVPIHEIGSHEGQHYFSMRFMEGGTLARVMARERHGPRAAAELIAKVARAVHHAHQRGILHRDLKPGNILLDEAGNPHVADFGLAKLLEQDGDWSQSAMALGTPSYMAPEQASGQTKQLSTAVDVYSLGAILYELLTGCVPFRGATPAETIRRVMDVIPRRPRLLTPGVDRDLEIVCLKCLEKDPQRRYGSANGLANDLERWRRGEPITARAVSTGEHIWKWLHRRPPIFFAMASAIVVCLFGGLWQWSERVKALERAKAADGITQELQAALLEVGKAREAEQTARKEADRANYFRNITWAQRDWEANNVARVEQLLDECPSELRGWEWRYLKRLSHSDLLTLHHSHPLKCVAFNRDGQYMAAGDDEGTIVVWSPMTGEELFRVSNDGKAVTALAFNPASDQFVSASGNFLCLWDTHSGYRSRILSGHSNAVTALAISADGQWLASGSRDKTIRIWKAATGELLRTLNGHTETVSSLAFSPDGTRLLSGSGEVVVENNRRVERQGEVKIWEVASGQLISTLGSHLSVVTSVACSFDGRSLAAGDSNGRVKLWEAGTFQQRADVNLHNGVVCSLAFSNDGRQLISGSADQTVRVWDIADNAEFSTWRGHTDQVNAITLSPDGKLIASVGEDNALKLWDAAARPEFKAFPVRAGQKGVALSPDGTLLAVTGVGVWNVMSGERMLSEGISMDRLRGVAFSSDGRQFAAIVSGGMKIWDTATWKAVHTLPEPGKLYSVTFSPDGKYVAACGEAGGSGRVQIWEVGSGKEILKLKELKQTAWSLDFSPDGSLLAVATGKFGPSITSRSGGTPDPGQVVIVDAHTGEVVHTFYGHKLCVWDVAFSPDGKTVASTAGYYKSSTETAEVKLWDMATSREIRTLSNQETSILSISFSADGKLLATSAGSLAAKNPSPVYLWDVSTGREVLTFNGHSGTIYDVAFSANGTRLASISEDGTVRVWDAEEVTPENQTARRAGVVGRHAMERARQAKHNFLKGAD